jgi:hypothetical protein
MDTGVRREPDIVVSFSRPYKMPTASSKKPEERDLSEETATRLKNIPAN